MKPSDDVPALVLAAGLGTRFIAGGGQGPKVLASLDGRPLVAHAIAVAEAAGLRSITVVLPPGLREAREVIDLAALRPEGSRIRLVTNDHAEGGISTTLAAGLTALDGAEPDADACVVLLADQPQVDPSVVEAVIAAWRSTRLPARARYLDGDAHPVVLPRALWPTLTAPRRDNDVGAGTLLATLDVTTVDVATTAPIDVDGPADLLRVRLASDAARRERRT